MPLTCPLCQANTELYQGQINKKFGTKFNMPVLYCSQLMVLAYGGSAKEAALPGNVIKARKLEEFAGKQYGCGPARETKHAKPSKTGAEAPVLLGRVGANGCAVPRPPSTISREVSRDASAATAACNASAAGKRAQAPALTPRARRAPGRAGAAQSHRCRREPRRAAVVLNRVEFRTAATICRREACPVTDSIQPDHGAFAPG